MAEVGLKKWIITITVITAAVMELIDTSIVNVALSQMSGNLGATLEDTAWVVTAYAIANVIIIPMTSFLSAQFGRQNYFVGSIILFTIASFLCGNAHSIWTLVIFRFIQGIGGGGLLSTSQAILFETFPVEERGLASGIFGLGIIIGPTIGPTLGGYIVDNFDWPWIFYVNIPVGIAATMLALNYVKDDPNRKKVVSVDWTGIGLLIVAIGSLQTVLERGQADDWFAAPYVVVLTALTFICGFAFIWWELRVEHPVVDLSVLKSSTLAMTALLTFALGFCLFATTFLVPVFAQRLLGYTAVKSGMLSFPGALIAAFLLPNVGRMIQRGLKPQILIVCGFVILCIFSRLLSKASILSGQGDFIGPLIVRGFGIACLTVPLTVLAVSELKPSDIPQGAALNNMMRQLGGSFGIAIINTYATRREAVHWTQLVSHLSPLEPATQQRVNAMTTAFLARGTPVVQAKQQAYLAIEAITAKQSVLLSYLDSFSLMSLLCLLCIPLVLAIKPKGGPKGPIVIPMDH